MCIRDRPDPDARQHQSNAGGRVSGHRLQHLSLIHIYIPVTPEEFESAMIMHGTGVEGLDNQNDAVQNVVVGKILSVRKHENSDHMVICSVAVSYTHLDVYKRQV